MKYIKTFEQFIAESVVNEKRITFRGKKVSDLYKLIKKAEDVQIFANNKEYAVFSNELKDDLNSDSFFALDKDGEEYEIDVKDVEFIEIYESHVSENSPALNASGVKVGDLVMVAGKSIKVMEVYKQINGSIIEFKGEDEDGAESTFIYDDGCDDYVKENDESGLSKAGHAALGMKQVRIVISGDSVEKNSDKILKFIEKADPNSKCEFFEKTGKIVGSFAKAKMDNIKRDLRGLDRNITIEIKNQTLR